jgi:hypothetical protein
MFHKQLQTNLRLIILNVKGEKMSKRIIDLGDKNVRRELSSGETKMAN